MNFLRRNLNQPRPSVRREKPVAPLVAGQWKEQAAEVVYEAIEMLLDDRVSLLESRVKELEDRIARLNCRLNPILPDSNLPRISYGAAGEILAANDFDAQGVRLHPPPPLPDPMDGVRDMEPTVSLGTNDALRRQEDRAAEGK